MEKLHPLLCINKKKKKKKKKSFSRDVGIFPGVNHYNIFPFGEEKKLNKCITTNKDQTATTFTKSTLENVC